MRPTHNHTMPLTTGFGHTHTILQHSKLFSLAAAMGFHGHCTKHVKVLFCLKTRSKHYDYIALCMHCSQKNHPLHVNMPS